MKIIKYNDKKAISESIKILSSGGLIVYPTDTLYGFGVDATNDLAIDRLNTVKGRTGPISVMAPNAETAIEWMHIQPSQLDVVPFYLGGPKTLIIEVKSDIVSKKILGKNNTLGIRVPNNKICNTLSIKFGRPITTTSVNRNNKKPLNDPVSIIQEFEDEIDLFIDSGTLPSKVGSTIYQLDKNNKIKILRE